MWPAVQELLKLCKDIRNIDRINNEVFSLRAYLVTYFGDIPAISMIICIKGHNRKCPCCMCNILGVSIPGGKGSTYYMPLDRSRHLSVKNDPSAIKLYDPANLPLQTHTQFLKTAH